MFTAEYAELYNFFHQNKDYRNEISKIIKILNFNNTSGLEAFDFGCGTGVHASEFFKIGVKVDGYDISQDMLLVAQRNYPNLKFSNNLNDFKKDYDFTYSLFDVVSYQTTTSAALHLIKNLFLKTKPGGYCLVDSWNSKGVLLDPPRANERSVKWKSKVIGRCVIPDLSQSEADIYNLRIDLIDTESREILKTESHLLRAWPYEEILEMMRSVGFKELILFNPVNPELSFNPSDWRFGVKCMKE